jgi:hypothetical protein
MASFVQVGFSCANWQSPPKREARDWMPNSRQGGRRNFGKYFSTELIPPLHGSVKRILSDNTDLKSDAEA